MQLRRLLDAPLILLLFAGLVTSVHAARNECLVAIEGTPDRDRGRFECAACDPGCRVNGEEGCLFPLRVCTNQAGPDCAPADIKKVQVRSRKHRCSVVGLAPIPDGSKSVCGAITGIRVSTRKHGKKSGTCKVIVSTKSTTRPRQTDKDVLKLVCKPQPAAACPTTTITTTTSTTSTTGIPCETLKHLRFTTSPPSSTTVTGDVKDPAGMKRLDLIAGGLYFGGGGAAVPLPAVVPDRGSSIVGLEHCDSITGNFDLAATTDAPPRTNRNCTAAGVPNPEYPGKDGCLFGPPLPIPDSHSSATSTCVVNRVTTSATGSGNYRTGELSSLNLPLGSDIYLTGDLLPAVAGIQPCPVCIGGTCEGGPNDGLACEPGSGALGDAYPTSHDCPPPGGDNFVATLPISFELTTGSASKVSKDIADGVGTDRLFCGFCATTFGVTFQDPPGVPCASNAECTNPGFPLCKQRTSGAFGVGDARTITETGTAAGDIRDALPHAATLVSVFCVPKSYIPAIDNEADLPGPGAVALTGDVQLLP